jgi:hypothetical protein
MGTMTYFNELDRYRREWLRNQMDQGLIAEGTIDDHSIVRGQATRLR